MRFEMVYYRGDKGVKHHVLLANPIVTNVVGTDYVHGKECNSHGLSIRPSRSYTDRHPEGDGVVWRLIPLTTVIERKNMIFDGERIVPDDGSAPTPV